MTMFENIASLMVGNDSESLNKGMNNVGEARLDITLLSKVQTESNQTLEADYSTKSPNVPEVRFQSSACTDLSRFAKNYSKSSKF